MAFAIDEYNTKDANGKVEYLISYDISTVLNAGVKIEDVYKVYDNAKIGDGLPKEVYHASLEKILGRPLEHYGKISTAIQNKAAQIQTVNEQFNNIVLAALQPNQPTYNKNMAFLFAKTTYRAGVLPETVGLDQAYFDAFINKGQMGSNERAGGMFETGESKKLSADLQAAVNDYLKNNAQGDEEPDSEDAVVETLAEAEAGNVDASTVTANSANTTDNRQPTEDDVGNYKQCMLMLAFLKKASTFAFDPNTDNTIWGDDLETRYTSKSHNGRIIPLWCRQPEVFLNACNFNPKFKRYFSRKSTSDDTEYVASLFYVQSTSDETGKIIGTKEIELNTKDVDCSLNTVSIEYKGTTPATARKDVKVTMTWTIKNFNFLKKDISFTKEDFKFYELITVPYGIAKGSTIGGSSLKTQYSPDYSRIRLKIKSRSNIKEYDLGDADEFGRRPLKRDRNGNVLYKEKENEIIDDYYIDLAITNHKMERDDAKHNVKVTIDYRGYFENMLSMPFMDALVSRQNLKNRFTRDRELNKLAEDCNPSTFREIVRLNRIGDSGEVSFLNFQQKLVTLGSFYSYTTNTAKIKQYIRDGNSTLNSRDTYVQILGPAGQDFNNIPENFDEEDPGVIDGLMGTDPEKKIKNTLSSTFCRLGDIMEAALSQLYEAGNNELLDEFKHLNLKFVFAPVTIINPFDPSRLINFNPLEMPIDYQFFDQWYNANIVNKKITYYPILTFIRDLTERVINGILFEACLSSRLPDEKPPMLRSGFFYSNRPEGELFNYERKGYYLDLDGFIDSKDAAEKVFQYKKDNGMAGISEQPVTNYCVIYSMNSNFFNLKGGVPMKSSKWVPTFRSGVRWTDGFMSALSFTQKNQKSGLREAKFFNTGNGLQVLSNVYDFSFTLDNVKPNNMLFPGQLIWFELWDFDNADIDPNTLNTLANVLTMGGYYLIKSVTHTLTIQEGKFTIKYDTLWHGSDTNVKFRRNTSGEKTIEINERCKSAYDTALERAQGVDATVKDTITSIEEILSVAIPVDESVANKTQREIRGTYDYSEPEDRKAFEGKISVYLQSSGNVYKQGSFEFSGDDGQFANVQVLEPAISVTKPTAKINITYTGVGGLDAVFSDLGGIYIINTKTGNMIRET